MIDAETYTRERAICDKAHAYARATMLRNGKQTNCLTAEEAKHPDYAACSNEMRGRVELFELHRDKPAAFSAYVNGSNITTWTGDVIGAMSNCSTLGTGWTWRRVTVISAWGVVYRGREYASMQLINLYKV